MLLADLAIVVLFLFGVALFRSPKRALYGTWVAGFALILAALSVSVRHDLFDVEWVLIGIVLGSTTGWWWAARSDSIKVPALVAFQNGAGGLASFLISMVELVRRPDSGMGVAEISGIIGLVLGAATFSASLLASARLAGSIGQKPVVWRGHHLYLIITSLAILGFVIPGVWETGGMRVACFGAAVGLSILLGLQFAVRVGGADMPVLISFLNANSGFAAAFCGLIVDHQLLVATGATVAASGSILTLAMCRAMNRSLRHVLWGGSVGSPMAGVESQVVPTPLGNPGNAEATEAAPALQQTSEADSWEMAKRACKEATSVIIVPGYGIALAEAHHELVLVRRIHDAAA
ncbi:MAG TPA: NAD(P)(+) transhydrogenase (Re/Si-specific) subunit beta, partial [Acidobacteriota bacterium]|nr:NAD(P)(+) transhydrogenase (Re/Si-specific) subunit beta [Acidobacteriota bacterium]